jgi:drug/metabolite transporter (DMT)-like permease
VQSYRVKEIVIRSLLNAVAVIAQIVGVLMIPIAIQSMIGQTRLIWVAMVAYFVTGEKVSLYKWIVFVLMLCTLGFMTHFDEQSESDEGEEVNQGLSIQLIGILLSIAAVASSSAAVVVTRVIWDVPPIVLVTYNSFVLVPIFTLYALLTTSPENPSKIGQYNFSQWMLIFGDTLLGFFAMMAATKGSQVAKSSFISLIMFMGVIYGTIFDSVLFDIPLTWQ